MSTPGPKRDEDVNPKWGFWIPVRNEASAHYAAKMSGLPVFMLGLSVLMFGLQFAGLRIWLAAGIALLTALFLLVSGLRIRSGKFGLLPISVGLWLIVMVIGVVPTSLAPTTAAVISTILNLIIGLLALSGLRGWWWLRSERRVDAGNE
ncbi:MAG: hypothetical protein ABJN69_12035 [Hellea sp.]